MNGVTERQLAGLKAAAPKKKEETVNASGVMAEQLTQLKAAAPKKKSEAEKTESVSEAVPYQKQEVLPADFGKKINLSLGGSGLKAVQETGEAAAAARKQATDAKKQAETLYAQADAQKQTASGLALPSIPTKSAENGGIIPAYNSRAAAVDAVRIAKEQPQKRAALDAANETRKQADEYQAQYYAAIPTLYEFGKLSQKNEETAKQDSTYDIINSKNRAEAASTKSFSASGTPNEDIRVLGQLTDTEAGTYNYLYAVEGKAAADRYLSDMRGTLNARAAGQATEKINELPGALGTALKASLAVPVGIDQAVSGWRQALSGEPVPASVLQNVGGMIREEAQRDNAFVTGLWDFGVVAGNMAPSVLISTVTGGLLSSAGVASAGKIAELVGDFALGTSAAGNAYGQALQDGYAPDQARTYGMLVGASEAGLQYLLGGVAKLGGLGADKIMTKIRYLDDGFARVALTGATKFVSEGSEEALQEYLEPLMRTLIFDESYDFGENTKNAVYAGLLGGLSGIAFGMGDIADARNPYDLAAVDWKAAADYFGADGVDWFAGINNEAEIEARFRELVKVHHPDAGGNSETFARIKTQRDLLRANIAGANAVRAAQEQSANTDINVNPDAETSAETVQAGSTAAESETDVNAEAQDGTVERGEAAPMQNTSERTNAVQDVPAASVESIGNDVTQKTPKKAYIPKKVLTADTAQRYTVGRAEPDGVTSGRAQVIYSDGYLGNDRVDYYASVQDMQGLQKQVAQYAQESEKLPVSVREDIARQYGMIYPFIQSLEGGKISDVNDSVTYYAETAENNSAPESLKLPTFGEEGTIYGQKQNTEAVTDAGRSGAEAAGNGAGNLLSGGYRRESDAGTGRTARSVEKVTGGAEGEKETRRAQLRSANTRNAQIQARPDVQAVNPRSEFGIRAAAENSAVKVFPTDLYDGEMRETDEHIYADTGKRVTYVSDAITLSDGQRADGVVTGNRVIVNACSRKRTVAQIADHEDYHDRARKNPELVRRAKEALDWEGASDARKDRTVEIYAQRYWDIYREQWLHRNGLETEEGLSPEMLDQMVTYVQDCIAEEIFADAYAGVNVFGATATDYTETIREEARKLKEEGREANQIRGPDEKSKTDVKSENTDFEVNSDKSPERPKLPEIEDERLALKEMSDEEIDQEYMDAVDSGDMVTADALIEKAAKSAGYTERAYHGTPNGTFTVFRPWQFFTTNKSYADVYQGQGASSNGYKKTANNQTTYSVFLDLGNVFDTRKPKERRIFMNEFFGKWGNGTPLSERGLPDWTDADDLIEFLEEKGYDYDSFLLDEGKTGGYGEEIRDRGISMVVRSPEQIKSADTITYDDDGNVIPLSQRFDSGEQDIRFSLEDPVEESDTLIAVHNLKESDLQEAVQLGGFPSPSIAIVRAEQGHTNYGPASVIFKRDTIDPRADSRNKVYSTDAWTPTRANARVDYEIDDEIARRVEKEIENLSKNAVGGAFHSTSELRKHGIEGMTQDDMPEIVRKIADSDTVRAAYLADQGKDIEPVFKEKTYGKYGNAYNQRLIDSFGAQKLADMDARIQTSEGLTETEKEEIRSIYADSRIQNATDSMKKRMQEKGMQIEDWAKSRAEQLSDVQLEDMILYAFEQYSDDGGTSDVIDNLATSNRLREAVNDDDVREWVSAKIQGIIKNKGIYNGKDPFTPSGKSRTFKELHDEYTLENIVRAMNRAESKGANSEFSGASGIIASAVSEFGDIDEIHRAEGRLSLKSEDEYAKITDELADRIDGIIGDIRRTNKAHSDNEFEEQDIISTVLKEAARGKKTADAIRKTFTKEGYRVNDDTISDIRRLFVDAQNIPTGYFEAKPQRAVGFDEVAAVVVPDNFNVFTTEELRKNGVDVRTYRAGDDADRKKVVNEIENVRFALSDEEENAVREKNTSLREILRAFNPPSRARESVRLEADAALSSMIANRNVSDRAAENLWEALIDSDAVTIEPEDDNYKEISDALRGTKIHVSDEVKGDLGDDWKDIKRRAQKMGITLTRMPSEDVPGIDQVSIELAERFPGYFDESPDDLSEALRRIVSNAEAGRSTTLTHAEYNDYLTDRGNQADGEYLDELRGKFDAVMENLRSAVDAMPEVREDVPIPEVAPARKRVSDEIEDALAEPKNPFSNWSDEDFEREFGQATEEITGEARENAEAEERARENRWNAADELAEGRKDFNGTNDEYWEDVERRKNEELMERLKGRGKREFIGSPALKALGIRVENSIGNYAGVRSLVDMDRAAKEAQQWTRKAEKQLKPTNAEKAFARGIADGVYDISDIPENMNAGVVDSLSDLYFSEKLLETSMIRDQKRDIRRALDRMASMTFRKISPENDPLLNDKLFRQKASTLVLEHRTPDRIMRSLFGETGKEIFDTYFRPVQVNEAERIRFVNRMYADMSEFTGKDGEKRAPTKAESALIQLTMELRGMEEYAREQARTDVIMEAAHRLENGEKPYIKRAETDGKTGEKRTITGGFIIELGLDSTEYQIAKRLHEARKAMKDYRDANTGAAAKADTVLIDNAVSAFGKRFDELYDATNDFLVAHGYEPIPYRKGYAPHMQEDQSHSRLAASLKALGMNTSVMELPTDLAGKTAENKPGKRWNPYFLQRQGIKTDLDIMKGYESYVQYLSDIFYHTDDIARVRSMSDYFRRTYAPADLREKINRLYESRDLDPDAKRQMLIDYDEISDAASLTLPEIDERTDKLIDELMQDEKNKSAYSGFVTWLDNYANILAGKQTLADRSDEYRIGRTVLNLANNLVNTFQRSNVAGNLSSSLNQTAQLPIIRAQLGGKYTRKALWDIARGKATAQWQYESDYLTGKKGISYLTSDKGEKLVSALFAPAEFMDHLMSEIAVRGAYLKALDQGKNYEQAMQYADDFGRHIMGSREKGTKPTTFNAKGPVQKMLNVFQIEVLNTWDNIASDLPAEIKEIARTQGKGAAAKRLSAVLAAMILGSFLMNRLTEELYGGTPAPFDIIGFSANFFASGEGLTTNQFLKKMLDDAGEKMFGERFLDTERRNDIVHVPLKKMTSQDMKKIKVGERVEGTKSKRADIVYSSGYLGEDRVDYFASAQNKDELEEWKNSFLEENISEEDKNRIEKQYDRLYNYFEDIGDEKSDSNYSGITYLQSRKFNTAAALEDLGYNVSNEVPYLNNVSALLGLGDKTLPLPDIYGNAKTIASDIGALLDEGATASEGLQLGKDVGAAALELVPGGKQLKKTAQGAELLARGGEYTGFGDKAKLKYPVSGADSAKALLFGKSATNANKEYYASGSRTLSAKETKLYQAMINSGEQKSQTYEKIKSVSDLFPLEGKNTVSDWQKAAVFTEEGYPAVVVDSALNAYLSKEHLADVDAAKAAGVSARDFVAIELARKGTKQEDAENAINEKGDRLTREQKAEVWRIITGAKTDTNNPYVGIAGLSLPSLPGTGGEKKTSNLFPEGLKLPELKLP